jgi:hypothetical protein
MLMLVWDCWGQTVEHYTSRRPTVTSATYCYLRNHLKPTVISKYHRLVSFCSVTTLGPIVLVQQLKLSKTCILGTFLVFHTLLTSPLLTTISLGHWRWLVKRHSALMKKCKSQCMSGCVCGQRTIFKRNPGISEKLKDMHWTQWGICWKVTKLYWTWLLYTSCEKTLFSFDLPSYNKI